MYRLGVVGGCSGGYRGARPRLVFYSWLLSLIEGADVARARTVVVRMARVLVGVTTGDYEEFLTCIIYKFCGGIVSDLICFFVGVGGGGARCDEIRLGFTATVK